MDSTTIEILNYLFNALNGITETLILFILVYADTALGGKWRSVQGVVNSSNGALTGWLNKMPLVFLPFITWAIGVAVYYLPSEIAGRTYVYDPLVFDVIAFLAFVYVANWTTRSIVANMELAGHDMPALLKAWAADEITAKKHRIKNEPKKEQ